MKLVIVVVTVTNKSMAGIVRIEAAIGDRTSSIQISLQHCYPLLIGISSLSFPMNGAAIAKKFLQSGFSTIVIRIIIISNHLCTGTTGSIVHFRCHATMEQQCGDRGIGGINRIGHTAPIVRGGTEIGRKSLGIVAASIGV